MHRVLVLLHRWLGLASAVFLFIAGTSGALIAWDDELDAWLNPQLYRAESGKAHAPRSSFELAEQLEQSEPRLRVRHLPLSVEPGHTLRLWVEPRVDPEQPHLLGFDQVALDPATGRVQGRRLWGALSLSPANLMPFMYKLHHTLHLPERFGIELGVLVMGIIAIVWVIDLLVALTISFPNRRSWRRSFAFRVREGRHKLAFDLHRSGGVWVFGLLLVMAVSAVSLNLGNQVVRPIVSVLSPLTKGPFDTPQDPGRRLDHPPIERRRAVEIASARAREAGLEAPPGAVSYVPTRGLYSVGFFERGAEHGAGGLGVAWLYVDGRTGANRGAVIPGRGSAGDLFLQLQLPLHSGRILGLPGRILVSVLGLVVSMLSVTGILIWVRKRRRRARGLAR